MMQHCVAYFDSSTGTTSARLNEAVATDNQQNTASRDQGSGSGSAPHGSSLFIWKLDPDADSHVSKNSGALEKYRIS
jgi:hypothetical protein